MSKEAVSKFIVAINQSQELIKQCREAVAGSKDAGAFARLGAANGFRFTAADAESYFQELLGAEKPGKLTELDESSLAKAAGGKSEQFMPGRGGLGDSVKLFRNLGSAPSWSFFR